VPYALGMPGRWDWVREIRERHFGSPLPDGYVFERVDADRYWDVHEAELREHFPPDAYFDPERLLDPGRLERQRRLAASAGADLLADHWLVRDAGGALAAVVSTCQIDASTFQLFHVNLHPRHRRRGLYRAILARVLAYAGELGFSLTVSEHAPSNNAVLIAHLRADFRILSMFVDALYGPSVRLGYFHDPQLLRAYEFRCGLAVMDPALHASGTGHFELLDRQFADVRDRRGDSNSPV
jgi:GNAT superfamily N-acetyltransferase